MTGFGLVGPEKDAPGYDVGVFYGKAGGAVAFTAMHPKYGDRAKPTDPPPLPPQIPGGFGDFTTALAGRKSPLSNRSLSNQESARGH